MQIGDASVTRSHASIASVFLRERIYRKGDATMKRLLARTGFLVAAAVLLTAPLKLPARSGTANTFRGEVTDTFCAHNGSHTEMMTKMTSMGRDKETCAKECAKIGA